MAIRGLHHLVILVDDVPEDEAYYRELFDMEVLLREGVLDDESGTVPEGMEWEEALSAGVSPSMSFLGRDEFNLAVATTEGDSAGGRVDHVALEVDEETFDSITNSAEKLGCAVERNAPHHRIIRDKFDLEWELNARSRPPSQAFDTLDI